MRPVLWKSFGLKFFLFAAIYAQDLKPGGIYRLQLEDGTIVEEALYIDKKFVSKQEIVYYFQKSDGSELSLRRFVLLPPEKNSAKIQRNSFYQISFSLNQPVNQRELSFSHGYRANLSAHFRPFLALPYLDLHFYGGYFYAGGKKATLSGPEFALGMGYLVPFTQKLALLSEFKSGLGFYELKNLSLDQKFRQHTFIFLLQNGVYYRISDVIGFVFRFEQNFIYDEKRPLWLLGGSFAFVYGGLL